MLARRMRAARHVSTRVFERHDLLLCPTLAEPPPTIGEFAPDLPFDAIFPGEKRHMPFAPIQNATGDPAISLPLGVSAAGLPIGVQFAAAPTREATLLSVAYELEGDGASDVAVSIAGRVNRDHVCPDTGQQDEYALGGKHGR